MRRAALLTALALTAGPVAASTFLALTQEDLVAQAESVIEGRIVEVRSFWNQQRTAILTEAVVAVDAVLAGESPARVRVRTFGGTVDGYTIEAHGFPTFERGERQLLFLHREKRDGSLRVLGYRQGQFLVVTRGGSKLAVPMANYGESILLPDGSEAPAPKARALAELAEEIRLAARREGRLVREEGQR